MELGDKLNPQRSYRKGFALKGLRQHIIKTNNPSTIGPNELLTVCLPDLKENQVIIPGTTKLTFNISLAGTDVNRTLVGNLGRNIIRKLVVKLEGNEIISTDDYDVLYSYYDCWKCTTERLNAVFQGIVEADGQMENAIKHRINVSETERMHPPADTSVNTCKPELTRTSRLIFNLPSRYCSYSRSLRVKHGDVVETQ